MTYPSVLRHLPLLLGSLLCAADLPPVAGDKAVFAITPGVVQANPARFGANIDPPAMSHWSTEPWHNQWWSGPAINPITARHKGTATAGSATTLEDDKGAKISYFDVFRSGFFDGGTVAVYRLTDGVVSLVREGRIATYEASKDGPNRLTFAEPGPAVQPGDEYVLTTVRREIPTAVTRTYADNPWWLLGNYQLEQGTEKALHAAGVRMVIDADAPPGGGTGSLRLTLPGSEKPVRVGTWFMSDQQADWPRLNNGKTYTVSVWLKQAGMATGAVEIRVGDQATQSVTATTAWQQHSFDFTAKPPKGTSRFDLGSAEKGVLWIDNVAIVEKDGPPAYGYYPAVVDTLKRFRPNTLRLWTLQENRGFGKALDDALAPPAEANLSFRESHGAGATDPLGLHRQLELCAQVGTSPWIITSTMFTGQEQRNLIEYLAGPADTPYGRKRAAWGQAKPWTAVFPQIKLEMGNETWNGMFAPQGFSGRGKFYGAYSDYMFRQMQSSPHWKADRFQLVINGWVAQTGSEEWAFGASALKACPSAQAIDIAYYTGGWDAVGLIASENPMQGWMNALVYSRRMLAPRAMEFKKTADTIAAASGRKVESLVYEAGPGYTLPAPGKFNLGEQREGKSLAHAINALDIFMSNLRAGYGDQSFFMFKNGHYWASHNRAWGEHIAWKALGMRNALLEGDLVGAEVRRMVTIDLPEAKADTVSQSNSANRKTKTFPPVPNLPLVDCYPFKQGKRWSFMLISRRLDGDTPVELELPFDPAPAYAVHTLGGASPDLHNIDSEVVTVVSEQRTDMTRTFSLAMPKHSVVVVVAQER
ncbi:MAG TPA: hypothetical protein DCS97_01050 [Planctomycetes bacterium]|nr:hypothetical protein [Planctomycetota bacterium]